jgi:hypothetical protein
MPTLLKLPSVENIPQQFDELHKAIIDTSSIIYMDKIGLLKITLSALKLITLPEVLKECRFPALSYKLEVVLKFEGSTTESTDKRLFALAKQDQLAVISEDKALIKKTMESGLPCFNSLMIMNFLFYHDKLTKAEYKKFQTKLKRIARYNQDVWDYGDLVFRAIQERKK